MRRRKIGEFDRLFLVDALWSVAPLLALVAEISLAGDGREGNGVMYGEDGDGVGLGGFGVDG